jgi:hypothetical protein
MGRFSMSTGGGSGIDAVTAQAMADAAEAAAAVYTDAAFATSAGVDLDTIPFRTGTLYVISAHAGLTTTIPGNRTSSWLPFRPAKACTLNKLAVEQTTAGEAGSTIRLAIAEDLDGIPSDVLWQSTALAGDGANGEKSADPDLAIVPSKLYYAGVALQAATTTRPALRAFQNAGVAGGRAPTTTVTNSARNGYSYTLGNDSAIPDPLVAGTVGIGGMPCPAFWLQAD